MFDGNDNDYPKLDLFLKMAHLFIVIDPNLKQLKEDLLQINKKNKLHGP